MRLRAWDGSEAGPKDGPVLVIRTRRALRRLLWAPGELGLARAYVSGDIDVDGDLADGFRRAWQLARSRPTTGGRARDRGTGEGGAPPRFGSARSGRRPSHRPARRG